MTRDEIEAGTARAVALEVAEVCHAEQSWRARLDTLIELGYGNIPQPQIARLQAKGPLRPRVDPDGRVHQRHQAESGKRLGRPVQDKCKRGHLFTPENTYLRVRGNWSERFCRECIRIRETARRANCRARKGTGSPPDPRRTILGPFPPQQSAILKQPKGEMLREGA